MSLLALERVSARYLGRAREVLAVEEVSLSVATGETLALVGESGCGKSTLGRVAIRLQPPSGGQVSFDGQDITRLRDRALRPLRPRMQMIFQDSTSALNPRLRIGSTLARPLAVHGVARRERAGRIEAALEQVGLPGDVLDRHPHELSGGQKQRLVIARALLLNPSLLVCDEPVSALDLSVQARVLNLLTDLRQRLGLAYLFISHDLGVVRHIAHRVAVMYLGRIVESGPVEAIWASPRHPYTRSLIDAVPGRGRVAALVRGDVPPRGLSVPGCAFHPHCPSASALCRTTRPELEPTSDGRAIACHHPLSSTCEAS